MPDQEEWLLKYVVKKKDGGPVTQEDIDMLDSMVEVFQSACDLILDGGIQPLLKDEHVT